MTVGGEIWNAGAKFAYSTVYTWVSLIGSRRRSTFLEICIEPVCSRVIEWVSERSAGVVMSPSATSTL